MNTYKDLVVWEKSIKLVIEIYKITNLFPREEVFGLVSQMKRSAVSIPSNIAEGYARKGKKENAHFVNIAFGSATELETQIIISKELKFLKIEEWNIADALLLEVIRMLYKYRKTLYE